MKASNIFSFLALVVCLFLFSASGHAKITAKPGSPMRAIQSLDDQLSSFKKGDHLTEADKAYNKNLKKQIINGTFDVRELSKVSLASHWAELSAKDQEKFTQLMTDILQEKALFSNEHLEAKKKGGSKYTVSYVKESYIAKKKDRAQVYTLINIPAERLKMQLNYKLKKEGTEWKIYDIIVDEASLVQNYKYQFNKIINKDGYGHLVGLMEKKLKQVKEERAAIELQRTQKKSDFRFANGK
ncbi:MAG: hypothetical protein COV43_00265 [Deltaproteobacteria bacterium CG11_big_fil_rev_8_21_14_0_20_42_23]|nr:MAG: hypothetical protein COV43_00265 [Deltaproteobacteria bacterium CG11_big_fil_rev_8_21_14_0_20_42_23]PJC64452.1 MAG: hypothetical protein CO021_04170 [Deltaproteobacteria bacterium CG_4_9_14_0_2_um_filter_42_21]